MSVLDDATPLAGPGIDPAVRMGWLVRTARLTARPDGGGSAPRLEDVAGAIGSNPTRLHRLETGQLRDGRLVEGYERALGLKRGRCGRRSTSCAGPSRPPARGTGTPGRAR